MCNKPGAEVLDAEGVRDYNYKLMSDDFLRQAADRPSKTQACFHAVLSFCPGEKPADELMVEIARKYLEKIGITDTQFAITKHTDKAHLHLHIIANMVDNQGKGIKDGWIGMKGKWAAQALTREYNLIPAERKDLALTNLEALSEAEGNRYKIYMAIMQCLPVCRSLDELAARLKIQGIETIFKYKGQTEQRQGISFRLSEDCFKGSKVDRKFSLANLEKTLQAQVKQTPSIRVLTPPPAINPAKNISEWTLSLPDPGQSLTYQLLTELLKPEYTANSIPYELLREARKKKGKRR